jgi:hypothetical protein
VSQAGELRSLAEHGISAIHLTRGLTGRTREGATDNVITAVSAFTRADGSQSEVGDVELAFRALQGQADSSASSATNTTLSRARTAAEEFLRSGRSPRLLAEALAEAMHDQASSIEDVDRSSDDDRPARPSEAEKVTPPKSSVAAPETSESVAPLTSKERWDDFRTPRSNRSNRSKWPSLENLRQPANDDEQWQGYQPAAQRSASHSSSSARARQRLLMIEAMASFAPEDAANLSLTPNRRIDARTLELLTSVQPYRSAL